MSEDEAVSRRQFFSTWARELAQGLAEFVLPEVEREADRLRSVFEEPQPEVETVHPWRDLLQPPDDGPHPDTPPPGEGEG